MTDIYKDILERTGGDIYIAVAGPVRTGKSTFIKRFAEVMMLPGLYRRRQWRFGWEKRQPAG